MKTLRISFFIFVVLLTNAIVGINSGYAFDKKKYSPMPIEEARKLVKENIGKGKPPSPGWPVSSYWELPDSDLYARGVRINDNDYIILASAKSNAKSSKLIVLPTTNLSKFIPEIEKIDYVKPIDLMPFGVNGILLSTVDFEIMDNQVLKRSGGEWTERENVIKKGEYVWYLGPVGILLSVGNKDEMLIAFAKPMIKYSPENTYLFDLSTMKDDTEIYFKVTNEVIRLK